MIELREIEANSELKKNVNKTLNFHVNASYPVVS